MLSRTLHAPKRNSEFSNGFSNSYCLFRASSMAEHTLNYVKN